MKPIAVFWILEAIILKSSEGIQKFVSDQFDEMKIHGF